MVYVPKRIIVDTTSQNDEITERVISTFGARRVTLVNPEELNIEHYDKSTLILTHNRGRFIKDFECTQENAWDEKYIVSIINCPFNCSYCYLQAYFKFRAIVIYTNTERMKLEVTEKIVSGKRIRLTTGEFSDSLALDQLTETISLLAPLFISKNTKLELRTKTSDLKQLRKLTGDPVILEEFKSIDTHTGLSTSMYGENKHTNIVVTWTLSPEKAIKNEEAGTASLIDRLDAIRRAASMNFDVAIRFDPIIPFYYDKQSYNEILLDLSKSVPGNKLERFELGILRFPSNLIEIIGNTRPNSNLLKGEYIRSSDGKYVLIRPLRLKIFRELTEIIRSYFPKVDIKLSMENQDTIKVINSFRH